jgi:predicted dehydrogenase
MRDIRVGLIRCDTHGAYYAALMDRHDPLRLRNPAPLSVPQRETWQAGGVHFYHYRQYNDPRRMTADFVEGFHLVNVWDEHRELAETLSSIFFGRPRVCDTVDQVSDDVDLVFIADCNGDGADHLALATPGLKKGVATFIDKPLAYSINDANALIRLAADRRAPLYSMSILGALPQTLQFRNRLPEVGQVEFGSVQGGGTEMAGHIHAILLALTVFGPGVQRVFSTGKNPLDVIQLDYGDTPNRPAAGVTITCNVGGVWHCSFHCTASGPMGAIMSSPLSDVVFPAGASAILRDLKEMVHHGPVPANFSLMIEGVAIAEAARRAHASGKAVAIDFQKPAIPTKPVVTTTTIVKPTATTAS